MSKDEKPKKPRGDYEVGYGKPPTSTRFQKGKSGNPSGRPKRRKTPDSIMGDAIKDTVVMTIDGRLQKVPISAGILKRLQSMALNGNVAAIREWNRQMEAYFERNPAMTEQQMTARAAARDKILQLAQSLAERGSAAYRGPAYALYDGKVVKIDRLLEFHELPEDLQREIKAGNEDSALGEPKKSA